MPTEISAAATLIGFWGPGANQAIPITYSFQVFVTALPYYSTHRILHLLHLVQCGLLS